MFTLSCASDLKKGERLNLLCRYISDRGEAKETTERLITETAAVPPDQLSATNSMQHFISSNVAFWKENNDDGRWTRIYETIKNSPINHCG